MADERASVASVLREGEAMSAEEWIERELEALHPRRFPYTYPPQSRSQPPEPEEEQMEREYPEWYDIGEVGA